MNTINVYAYLNYYNPMTAWEIAIGRIQSICKAENKYGISMFLYGRLQRYSDNHQDKYVIDEFNLELYRREHYPKCNSRITCLYFFETYNEAVKASKIMGFDDSEDFISEVSIEPIRYSKLDSNWITYCLGQQKNNDWMDKYWSGQVYPNTEPNWELLIDGFGIVYNTELRQRAYKYIYEIFPYSTPLLSMAVCVFASSNDFPEILLMQPFIRLYNNVLSGDYIMKMQELNEKEQELVNVLENYLKLYSRPICKFPPNKDSFCNLPDMRIEHFEIDLSQEQTEIIKKLLTI